MKKIANNIKFSVTIAVVMLIVTSCKKYLDVPYPTNSINTESAFKGMATIDGMMNQLYLFFGDNVETPFAIYTFLPGISDEGYNPTTYTTVMDAQTNNINPSPNNYANSPLDWNRTYHTIYLANLILEGIPGATAAGFTDDKKKEYSDAAKAIRAYAYFQLVRVYGDVPLITNTEVPANALRLRDPAATVYAAIEKDLQDVIADLPATPGAKYFINNKYIPEAMLAEVYLTEGKWAQAETAASDIINSNNYQLEAINDVFLQSSNEGILVNAPVASYANPGNNYKLGQINTYSQFPDGFIETREEGSTLALSPDLLSSFEPGDQRMVNWVTLRNSGNYPNPNNRMFAYKYKYSQRYTGTIPAGREEDDKIIRLAEIYLIRAEARARLNKIADAAADLNMIRNRAGLGNTTAVSQTDMVNAILNERRHELFFEGGNRWFDLVRTGTANAVLSAIPYKVNWKPYMVLFPLTTTILTSNPKLSQTPGY